MFKTTREALARLASLNQNKTLEKPAASIVSMSSDGLLQVSFTNEMYIPANHTNIAGYYSQPHQSEDFPIPGRNLSANLDSELENALHEFIKESLELRLVGEDRSNPSPHEFDWELLNFTARSMLI